MYYVVHLKWHACLYQCAIYNKLTKSYHSQLNLLFFCMKNYIFNKDMSTYKKMYLYFIFQTTKPTFFNKKLSLLQLLYLQTFPKLDCFSIYRQNDLDVLQSFRKQNIAERIRNRVICYKFHFYKIYGIN